MAAVLHLGFYKSNILTVDREEMVKCRQVTKFGGDQLSRYRDIAVFRFSRWRPSAILDIKKSRNFIGGRGAEVELRHPSEFHRNRPIRCRVIAIFYFPKVAAVRHLGFVVRVFGPPTKRIWWSLSLRKIWFE